ncbi:MAG: hypothetical protein PHC34_09420 [Candidatus Gastranaerophilales bacterium]|nr:hypothetical protein [Candidatus Gastranaerophilales bacterium]
MDKNKALEVVKSLQEAVEQMRIDDLEESPESALETFQCYCCGQEKEKAGSMVYQEYLLCNDCVLIAETSMALGKISNIEELINSMEDKRLETECNLLIEEQKNQNNEKN